MKKEGVSEKGEGKEIKTEQEEGWREGQGQHRKGSDGDEMKTRESRRGKKPRSVC